MKKFYLFVLTAICLFLIPGKSCFAQYSTFNVVGNVSDPAIWAPPGQPPLTGPCSGCTITLNGTITDDLNDLILNNGSTITISAGSTVFVNYWIELHDNTQVFVMSNATLFVNDEVDLVNGSSIRLANGTSVINANNDLALGHLTGPNVGFVGPGVYYLLGGGNFDVTLAGNGLGQQTNTGANFFDPYTINCGVGAEPACAFGIVYGPAITQSVSGFVEFVATTPLPVTLVQFAGKLNSDHTVGLTWSTSMEVNSDYYGVQRSSDGTNWVQLGTVKANGFSSVTSNYSYTDASPLSGTNYYRLKMVDLDGKYQYSKVISVSLNEKSVPLVIYNNPFTDEIRLKVNTSISDNLSLVLSDATGKILLRQNLSTQAGDNLVNLAPAGVARGMYILTISGNGYYQTAKLIKQ
jgi:hypothetical protein